MEFTSWYWMKTGTCPNWATFMTWIKDFYWRMKDEGIDDIRSDGARALMKASKHIDFAS